MGAPREVKRKIKAHMKKQHGLSVRVVTNEEVVGTIETLSALRRDGRLDPKMRLLLEALERAPHPIEVP